MKALVVFYSRTGTTAKVARSISDGLGCDIEEIVVTENRAGLLGYLMSGMEATFKRPAVIKGTEKDASSYDLVLVGTPIWSVTISSPVRAYLIQNKGRMKGFALFCTSGGIVSGGIADEAGRVCGTKPLGFLNIRKADVEADASVGEVRSFLDGLMRVPDIR
jgi:flavodoxin